MIKHHLSIGNRLDYINVDALYVADQKLTDAIDELSISFVMDIRESQHVFLEEPKVFIPPQGARGRKPKNLKANLTSKSVKEYAQNLSEKDFKNIKVRNTAKGRLKCQFHFSTLWIWDKLSPKPLFVIKEAKSEMGLDQYQTRKWIAWYHQVALIMLLLLFLLRGKLFQFKFTPLLSAYDIRLILEAPVVNTNPSYIRKIIDVIHQNY